MRVALIIILGLGLEIAARAAHVDLHIDKIPGWIIIYIAFVPILQDLKELFKK